MKKLQAQINIIDARGGGDQVFGGSYLDLGMVRLARWGRDATRGLLRTGYQKATRSPWHSRFPVPPILH